MGDEARCTVRVGRKTSAGKALLESTELIFRGDFKLVIPFKQIRATAVKDGTLEVTYEDGIARFELGDRAAKWAAKIKSPRDLYDKLGVKPTMTVAVIGLDDAKFLKGLKPRADEVIVGRVRKGVHMVLLGAESIADLKPLRALRDQIDPAGSVWVVWTKGHAALREDDVRGAALTIGMVDVKVAAFSEKLSALKLVIRVVNRPKKPSR